MKEMMHKNHLLNIFLLSIKNLFEPNIFKWVLYTTILTLIALSLLSFGIVYYVKDWLDTGIPFLGNFLMYGATIIFSLFQDKIIDQIEEKYFPEVSKQLKIKFFTMLFAGIKLLGWSILINIIIFPLALFWGSSFFWVPINILITGYLISKEYSEALGLRKLSFIEVKELRNELFWPCWLFGIIGALIFFIPIVNLFAAPFVAILILHTINSKGYNGPISD